MPLRTVHALYIAAGFTLAGLVAYDSYGDMLELMQLQPRTYQDEYPPCGEVCQYRGMLMASNTTYPQLRKTFDCQNTMKRMAYRNHPIVFPPPRVPPPELFDEFTQFGESPIKNARYILEAILSPDGEKGNNVSAATLNDYVRRVKIGENMNMYEDGRCVIDTLRRYRADIKDKTAVVIGTQKPWLEAMMLAVGARHVTTLEYSNLILEHPQTKAYSPYDFADMYIRGEVEGFEVAATFSSLEHSGLGRYGDPLNPYGDLEAMAQTWCMLKPGGLFFVGIPCTADDTTYISYNAHRFYGTKRIQYLLANWQYLEKRKCKDVHLVFVLRKT